MATEYEFDMVTGLNAAQAIELLSRRISGLTLTRRHLHPMRSWMRGWR